MSDLVFCSFNANIFVLKHSKISSSRILKLFIKNTNNIIRALILSVYKHLEASQQLISLIL
jgi:hypothetical protein